MLYQQTLALRYITLSDVKYKVRGSASMHASSHCRDVLCRCAERACQRPIQHVSASCLLPAVQPPVQLNYAGIYDSNSRLSEDIFERMVRAGCMHAAQPSLNACMEQAC